MYNPPLRLSPDLLGSNTTTDDSSLNGLWPQMSLDRLLEHHDIAPGEPISINNTTNNDFYSSSAQFKEFFNNYHRQYQQQNQPIDISSLLSSSPPQQQQHQQQQQHFPLPPVDNHIFEPQPDAQPLNFEQYLSDNNQMSIRHDPMQQYHQHQSQPYANRSQPPVNFHRQQYHRTPPLLHIPNEDYYQQQQQQQPQQQIINPPRFKQNQYPAYVACLNHGINYNGVSGPPILLPPSF